MRRGWYYLALGIVIGGILLRQPALLVIGLLMIAVLLLIDIWATWCLVNLRYTRRLSEKRVLFGEQVTLSLSLENAKLLPLPWVEVEDLLPLKLLFRGRRPPIKVQRGLPVLESLFSPRWYERITRSYRVYCLARGVHSFGPARLRSGDLFGFLIREVQLAERDYLLVYPPVVPITQFGLPARRPFGDEPAPKRLLEDPARIAGTRDYRYGDELRRVHWKASARAMQLQSKVYESSTTYTLALFLNVQPLLDTHDFSLRPELHELAVCAAASIADWALNEGYAVGLYANTMLYMPERRGDLEEPAEREGGLLRRLLRLPPASEERQRQRIMEMLARLQAFYYGVSIEEVMLAERTRLPMGTTVVLITARMSEAMQQALLRLRRSGHAVSVLLVGETPALPDLPGISLRRIGGEETWRRLEALYWERLRAPHEAAAARTVTVDLEL
jgi:uncharacterized protein (DUF58 family)